MAGRSGLVSYGGDSEISDSEEERTPVRAGSVELSAHVIGTNDLGIPASNPHLVVTPPTLPAVVVEAAPTTLVDYTMHEEDDEDHNASKDDDETVMVDESGSSLPTNETETSETQDGEENTSMNTDSNVPPLYLCTTDVILPPEPPAKCSKTLQNKIVNLLQKRASSGVDLNSSLQSRKDLRNPSILEKLVQFCDLQEFGTNYPEHIYNPNEFTEESMYDNLYLQQQNAKKEKIRNTIEFVKGTKKAMSVAAATASMAAASGDTKSLKRLRKTKWDVGGGTDSGGSRGTSPSGSKERSGSVVLGSAPAVNLGLQPRVLQSAVVGAQARAQASQVKEELKKTTS